MRSYTINKTPSETGTSQLRWLRLLSTEIQWISDTEIQCPEEPYPELQVEVVSLEISSPFPKVFIECLL